MSDALHPVVRVALLGYGRMGRAIDALAATHQCEVVARLDAADVSAVELSRERLADADVAIDFTVPHAAVPNATACLDAGVPVVIGTTGWLDAIPALEAAVRRTGGRALWSPNFSLGVQLTLALMETAGRLFRHAPGFDAHLVETHHTAKLDAPSGTAIALRERAEAGLGRPIPVTSVRVGAVPGTHELLLDAPFESISIRHEARDRRVFAEGALVASRWLAASRASGLYTMRDVLGLSSAGVGDVLPTSSASAS
ncbi:MAG: 4-hydroxy-tetrahydrodipicolinate reductase [Gemmatimonadaceae bacterium]|nr:4-hydroxy-tetrahydrodipicolinate reductase [Gemmatimonadaceae bacterium]